MYLLFIFYIIIIIPIWIIFRFTTNYHVLFACRAFMKNSFRLLLIIIFISNYFFITLPFIFMGIIGYNDSYIIAILFSLIFLIVGPFSYNIWISLFSFDFYNKSHIKYLKYFVLYLRSFCDDKIERKKERVLLSCIYNLFTPVAIGRPNEIKSLSKSKRLYVGEEWKESVTTMMDKAPIILLRINKTESFFWEFSQCVLNKHMWKSIFWVSNKINYIDFKITVESIYNIKFPPIEKISDNSLIYQNNDEFIIFNMNNKLSYHNFIYKYYNYRTDFKLSLKDYLYRKSFLKILLHWKHDPNMLKGIQYWDWIAFLFPEFYVVTHRIKYRNWLYFILLYIDSPIMFFYKEQYFLFLMLFIPRLIVMYLFGINGRAIAWYSNKWESLEYFNLLHKKNNIITLTLGLITLVLCIIIFENKSFISLL